MKNTRWITKRLMKMTCRLHVGYEIVGYKKKICVAVIPSIFEAALAGVTPANNIGHRTKIAMANLLRTLPMVLAKQARSTGSDEAFGRRLLHAPMHRPSPPSS